MTNIVAELSAAIAADTPFLKDEDRRRCYFLLSKINRTVRQHLPQVLQAKIIESIKDSSRIHSGIYRKDGTTPYILHLLEVACILIDSKIHDFKTLCAAILHDTVEDTEDPDEKKAVRKLIKTKYGAMVCRIVELLSKHKGENKDLQWKRMLNEPDLCILWRVLTIKYADRIHNAQTFNALKREDLERKVTETKFWFPVIKKKLEECLKKLWVKGTLKTRSRLHLPHLLQNKLDAALEPYL